MPDERVKKLLARFEDAKSDAYIPMSDMQDISQYIFPARGLFVYEGEKPHKTSNRYSKIIDPVATEDNDLLASGIQGGLSSPSQPWFKLETTDPALMDLELVTQWLYDVQQKMYAVLAASNFYDKIQDFYGDQSAFGTGVIFSEENPKTLVTYKTCAPGEYFLAEGKLGFVDTIYRLYWQTARQIKTTWPDTCSDQVKQADEKKPQTWFKVLHAVEPNNDRDITKTDNLNMAFKSSYVEFDKADRFLSESGYNEQPFSCGRWKTNGSEVYGRGPGHTALGLVKMLQSMQKTSLKAFHKEADPPLLLPALLKDRANTLPGGVNYANIVDSGSKIGRLFDMRFDYQGAEAKIERIEEMIHHIFKRDLFLLIADRPEMTATEVIERSQEKIILLGPTITRNIHDVLTPQLERLYFIMERVGLIPMSPPELQGAALKFEFVSVLAQAQKMIGLQNLRSYIDTAINVASIYPDSIMKTNWDAVLQETADRLAVNPNITFDNDTVSALRAQQQKIQQLSAELEMIKTGSEAARNLANAGTDEKNALTEIIGKQ